MDMLQEIDLQGDPEKDGEMIFEPIAQLHSEYFVLQLCGLCMYNNCNYTQVNFRMHCVGTTPMFGDMFVQIDDDA